MVEFIVVNGNNWCILLEPPRRSNIVASWPIEVSYCEIQRGNSTGRDPRTHHAFTHHICAEHNVVVKWI